jgi:hypothetical protein
MPDLDDRVAIVTRAGIGIGADVIRVDGGLTIRGD